MTEQDKIMQMSSLLKIEMRQEKQKTILFGEYSTCHALQEANGNHELYHTSSVLQFILYLKITLYSYKADLLFPDKLASFKGTCSRKKLLKKWFCNLGMNVADITAYPQKWLDV